MPDIPEGNQRGPTAQARKTGSDGRGPSTERPNRRVVCTADCTVDCGRCKGDPLGDLRRRMRRWLWFRKEAHGGVPFWAKHYWQQGFQEAQRAVEEVFDGLG